MQKKERKCPTVGSNVFIAPGAVVVGDVTLEDGVSVWFHSTVRGDKAPIAIGKNTNIQDNAVLHVETEIPLQIGEGCSVAHGAILHGCQVGNNTLVGMGAIVLNGAVIGNNCIIGANTMVTQNKEIPDGSLVLGSPGKVVRSLTEEEIEANQKNAQAYIEDRNAYLQNEYDYIIGTALIDQKE